MRRDRVRAFSSVPCVNGKWKKEVAGCATERSVSVAVDVDASADDELWPMVCCFLVAKRSKKWRGRKKLQK